MMRDWAAMQAPFSDFGIRICFVIRHSTFVIASIPAFVFLEFLAKVLFPKKLNHP
jgi:hypothetical protein